MRASCLYAKYTNVTLTLAIARGDFLGHWFSKREKCLLGWDFVDRTSNNQSRVSHGMYLSRLIGHKTNFSQWRPSVLPTLTIISAHRKLASTRSSHPLRTARTKLKRIRRRKVHLKIIMALIMVVFRLLPEDVEGDGRP